MQSKRASEALDPRNFRGNHPEFLEISYLCPNLQHGVSSESSRLASQIFFIYFHFRPHPSPSGPLWRVPVASKRPPERVISRIHPKPGLWGIIWIVSNGLSNFFYFLSFLTSSVPQDPSEGSWQPPNGLPKGSFLESNQNLGYGVSSESSRLARQSFLVYFHFWPHPSPQCLSIFLNFFCTYHPRTPPKGTCGLLKMVPPKIEPKHGLLDINRIDSMHLSNFF